MTNEQKLEKALLFKDAGQEAKAYEIFYEVYLDARTSNDVDILGEVACKLGECYLSGEGVKEDAEKAFMYFKEGTACGNTEAKAYFATALLYGTARYEVDVKKGTEYLVEAASEGSFQAIFMLAEFYESGEFAPHIPQNFDKVVECYKRLKAMGYPYADTELARFKKPLFGKNYQRIRCKA